MEEAVWARGESWNNENLVVNFQGHRVTLLTPTTPKLKWRLALSTREFYQNRATVEVRLPPEEGLRVEYSVNHYNVGAPRDNEEYRTFLGTTPRRTIFVLPQNFVGEQTVIQNLDGYPFEFICKTYITFPCDDMTQPCQDPQPPSITVEVYTSELPTNTMKRLKEGNKISKTLQCQFFLMAGGRAEQVVGTSPWEVIRNRLAEGARVQIRLMP